MLVKTLKTFRHGTVNLRHGSTVEIVDARAQELARAGLVELPGKAGRPVRATVETMTGEPGPGVQLDGQGLPPVAGGRGGRPRKATT